MRVHNSSTNESGSNDDDVIHEDNIEDSETTAKVKKKKPGIIYLASIPRCMTAASLRNILSQFGEIGRVYLQEDIRDAEKVKRRKKKAHARNYSEGWVEFKSKRVAKRVVELLNNTQISERKKNKFFDSLWIMKYLPRFKWTHLSERLTYEQAVRKQRMRTEINQAKREADFFSTNVERSEELKKKKSKGRSLKPFIPQVHIKQRETEELILQKKHKKDKLVKDIEDSGNDRDEFLKSLFS